MDGLSFLGPPDAHVRAADGVNVNAQREDRAASYWVNGSETIATEHHP
jgi:hypothetical protein